MTKQQRQKLEVLVESKDIDIIRELILREYGFVATDLYIKDLIVFVAEMLDGRDDRNTDF
jgi:hypothetical protein